MSAPSRRESSPRWLVLSEGYHGHSDQFISLASPAAGVPHDPGILPLQGNEDLIDVAAAVIVEPVITDWSRDRVEWLKSLQDRCKEAGAVLIFDEVITGFRFREFSVTKHFGLAPDLVVIGKAIANGMPLAAVLGPAVMMSNPAYFVSSTYAGDMMSLAACMETIRILKTDIRYRNEDTWEKGGRFIERFNEIKPDLVKIEGYPTRGVFKARDELALALFLQETCKAGILFCRSWFFNADLAEHTDLVIETCRSILTRIDLGQAALEGEMPQSPFSMKVRNQA